MKLHYLLLLLVFPIFSKGQNVLLLKTYDHKKLEGNNLKIYAENGLITLNVIQANIIKISYSETHAHSIMDKEKQTGAPINIRVTQNLDDIFMFTDSLIIIVNKIDFSIKFEKRNEELLVVNSGVFLNKGKKMSSFDLMDDETFSQRKHRLNTKRYKLKSTTSFYSSKNYALMFASSKYDRLDYRKTNPNQIQFFTENNVSYYFVFENDKTSLKL